MNEFVPQNPRTIFIPLTTQPYFSLKLPLVMLPLSSKVPATESSLNADVPEFQPRSYAVKETISDPVKEKSIGLSEPTESCILRNAFTLTESDANSVKNRIQKNSYDPTNRTSAVDTITEKILKNTRTDRGNKSSHIFYKAELDDRYPNNVMSNNTANNNLNYSARNRFRYNKKGKVNEFENINNHDSNIKNDTNNKEASNAELTATSSAKIDEEPTKCEKPENAGLTYAQMLAISNPNVPTQIEPENLSTLVEPIGKRAISSKIKQSTKPNSTLKNITLSTKRATTPIKTVEGTLPMLAVKPEWHTVRSKCRKKNDLTEGIFFGRIKYGPEDDVAADKTSILQNETVKVTKNIEKIDRSCTPALTEDRALFGLHKNPTLQTKSKKKSSSKKNKKNAIERFCEIEPKFCKKNNSSAYVYTCKGNHDEKIISPLESAMFASPVPSLVRTPLTSSSPLRRQAVKAGLVGLNKCDLNLRQKFGIFQIENESENIALKTEEEMVMRVLEQLNMNDKFESNDTKPNASIERTNSKHPSTIYFEGTTADREPADWDADRFTINAKPHQNSYASNHFLGRFFGDNDDKRKNDLRSPSWNITTRDDINIIEMPTESNIYKIFEDCVQEFVDSGRDTIDERKSNPLGLILNLNNLVVANSVLDSTTENELLLSSRETMEKPTKTTDVNVIETRRSVATNEIRRVDIERDFNHSDTSDKSFRVKYKYSKNGYNLEEIVDDNLSSSTLNDNIQMHVVDTEMLEQQKKMHQTFPITAAVSHWLNQAQMEKTTDSILRMPNDDCQFSNAQFDDRLLMTAVTIQYGSQENTDVDCYSTDDSYSINHYQNQKRNYANLPPSIDLRKHEYFDSDEIDDAEDDDESFSYKCTSQSPALPIYGNSTNYENLLNEKKNMCNNVANSEADCEIVPKIESDQNIAYMKQSNAESRLITANNYNVKSPEVCCIIM